MKKIKTILMTEIVQALCCLRGVKTLTAMILLTEIGDIRRFRSPRAFMAWVGLVPQERSSGSREQRGRITKNRRKGMPTEIVGIALKAQHRLSNRFRRLARRKDNRVVVTAVARELRGFVWAIMKEVSPATA